MPDGLDRARDPAGQARSRPPAEGTTNVLHSAIRLGYETQPREVLPGGDSRLHGFRYKA